MRYSIVSCFLFSDCDARREKKIINNQKCSERCCCWGWKRAQLCLTSIGADINFSSKLFAEREIRLRRAKVNGKHLRDSNSEVSRLISRVLFVSGARNAKRDGFERGNRSRIERSRICHLRTLTKRRKLFLSARRNPSLPRMSFPTFSVDSICLMLLRRFPLKSHPSWPPWSSGKVFDPPSDER